MIVGYDLVVHLLTFHAWLFVLRTTLEPRPEPLCLEWRNLLDNYIGTPAVVRSCRQHLCAHCIIINNCVYEPVPTWLVASVVPRCLVALVRLHEIVSEVCAVHAPIRQGESNAPPYVNMA